MNKNWKEELAVMLLGLIEKLIPAIFVHWNNTIKIKKEKAEADLRLAKYELEKMKIEKRHDEKNSEKTDVDVIDDFLNADNKDNGKSNEVDATE